MPENLCVLSGGGAKSQGEECVIGQRAYRIHRFEKHALVTIGFRASSVLPYHLPSMCDGCDATVGE